MLKKISFLATLLFGFTSNVANAQSFLDKVTSSSVVSTVVSTITGGTTVSTTSIAGDWNYSSPAVSLEGGSTLESAAATLVTSQAETKLSTMFSKVGLTSGTFSFTFGSDGSFSCTAKGKTFSGTYTLDSSKVTLSFSAANTVNLGSMSATASIESSSLSLLFDADKLLDLVSAIASVSNNSSIQTVQSFIENYDGIMLGFKLSK